MMKASVHLPIRRHILRTRTRLTWTLTVCPGCRSLSISRSYQTSKSQKQIAVDATRIDAPMDAKPRPFAVERIGGRECHVSWGEGGVAKEWRELPVPAHGREQDVSMTASFTGRFASWLRQMFLPTNYPQSVHRSYWWFHVLQFVEGMAGTIVSVLCNQALLSAVGVSAEGSIFGAVAVQWIIKDGAGEIAKLFFIRRFSPFFDSHPKTIALFGEGVIAFGSALQMATVLVHPTPTSFLLCAAGGNIFKLVGYAIWSTTHMKWMRYFSLQGNMGDVAAKDESQNSLAQLVGYVGGIGLLTLSHSPAYLYALFVILTPIHLASTTAMMQLATFELLTLPRLSLLAQGYASGGELGSEGSIVTLREMDEARSTGPFGEFFKRKSDRFIDLAPRVADAVGSDAEREPVRWEICTGVLQHEKYLLYPSLSSRDRSIAVFYHPDAASNDTIRSILHAARLRRLLAQARRGDESVWQSDVVVLREALEQSLAWTNRNYDGFKKALEIKGWRTDEVGFADRGHRLLWGPYVGRGS